MCKLMWCFGVSHIATYAEYRNTTFKGGGEKTEEEAEFISFLRIVEG